MNAKTLQQTITNAAWNWDFYKFCKTLDFRAKETDAHSVEMFEALQELNNAVNRFDADTLQTLLDAAMDE